VETWTQIHSFKYGVLIKLGWEILKHAKITGSAAVLDSGTFTAKKHLKVIIAGSVVSGTMAITFNGVTPEDSRYPYETSDDYASSYSGAGGQPAFPITNSANFTYCVIEIFNVAGEEKQMISKSLSSATGITNYPVCREGLAKWTESTAQITSVKITNNSGGALNCNVGSYITVLGAEEPATADDMEISSIPVRKHLKAQMFANGTGGTINCNMTFNGSTSGYSIREEIDGGSSNTNHSQSNTDNLTGTVTGNISAEVNITNELNKEKLFISDGLESATGASSAVERKQLSGKWANNAQVTTIKCNNSGSGSYNEGSELIVWGSDGSADIITTGAITNIVGGFIFEETETGKHYIWNATTSTWTEIA